jgi:autotransporter-associated beta strand protein
MAQNAWLVGLLELSSCHWLSQCHPLHHPETATMWKSLGVRAALGFICLYILIPPSLALDIVGYDPTHNNRFSSGYPSAPIPNTNAAFIGLGYNWSGVGWNSSFPDPNRSFAMLGPRHFLFAKHYIPGTSLEFYSSDGQLRPYSVQMTSSDNNGFLGPTSTCDLAVGVLNAPIPSSDNVTSYPILFLGYSATPYIGREVFMYGWTARIGKSTVDATANGVTTSDDVLHTGYYFHYTFGTANDQAKVVLGDSGSPSFFYEDTPEGKKLYLAGAHFAASSTEGYDSDLPMMLNYINAYMAQTGYLPYVVTPPTATWQGDINNSWNINNNWNKNAVPADILTGGKVTTCASVLFDGATAVRLTVNLNGNQTVTGITFSNASGSNPFTFAGGTSDTLTIGEAGITNKDVDLQTFTCNMALRSPQRWTIGPGGLSVSGTINTGSGNLLLIEGDGNTSLSGAISNTGSLAKDGLGVLTLSNSSANTFTGKTFINGGTIAVTRDNLLGAAPGSPVADQLRLNGGTLQATDSFTLNGNRGIAMDSLGGILNVDSNKTLTVNSIISTLSGASSSPLTKSGNGTLILNAANTYAGTTTITSGTLQIGSGGTSGALGAGSVTDNGILIFNRSNNLSIFNAIGGSGSLQHLGTGSLTLGGANTYEGTTTVVNGLLKLANSSALGATSVGTTVQNGGTLDINGLSIGLEQISIDGMGSDGNGALINSNALSTAMSSGPVFLNGDAGAGGSGDLTLSGAIIYNSHAFSKTGSDILTLTGPQIWGNSTSATVNSGTLSFQQTSGAITVVGTSNLSFYIMPGASVNVDASNNDPFTDDFTPARHAQVVNDPTANFNITAGGVSVSGISGGGATSVSGSGAILNTPYIYQNLLTIGAGSKVVISPLTGSDPLLNMSPNIPIGSTGTYDLAYIPSGSADTTGISTLPSLTDSTVAGIVQSAPALKGFSLVPEPATWILVLTGILGTVPIYVSTKMGLSPLSRFLCLLPPRLRK